jgi:tetratricopeptide (TPR) repeat protein
MKRTGAFLCLALSAVSLAAFADDHHHHDDYDPSHLGKVSFPTSCEARVQGDFNQAVALLHSFWYEEARKQFEAIAEQDPKCSMAYWGVAMSHWHQLWDAPSAMDIADAQQALDRAIDHPAKTERERVMVEAARAYFWRRADSTPEERAQAYSLAMAKAHQQFPADTEITVFYALSLLAAAPPGETNLELRKQAGALLEPILQANPQHPGAAHYLIHAYDTPQLAELGLPAARAYAKVAPSAPHALHMPSHIFSRLGMWRESIQSNLASIAATRHSAAMNMGGADHQMHAMDFLQYAYLQSGQEAKAEELRQELEGVRASDAQELEYTRATMAVRDALERRQWTEAESLQVPAATEPWLEATVREARAEGAARLGHLEEAQGEVSRLKQMESNLHADEQDAPVALIVAVERQKAEAWLKLARGQNLDAITEMRQAALADEKTGGEGVRMPAYEELGDLLLKAGHADAALEAYEEDLKLAPNRFDALYGAARAAQAAGRQEIADRYYSELLHNAGSSRRPEVGVALQAVALALRAGK